MTATRTDTDADTAAGAGADAGGDAAIVGRSLREPEAFAGIFDRYYDAIHGFAARRLGREAADDVAAETFLIAFDRRGAYDLARPDARPWLYGIASNLIARRHRAEARQYRALVRTGLDGPSEGPEQRAADRLDASAARGPLAAALADLNDGDRDVLLLVAWADLTPQEVGEALGLPGGTVRSRLHRARARIRAALPQNIKESA